MAVYIECHASVGVAEAALNDFDMFTCSNEERYVAMAEVMEVQALKAGFGDHWTPDAAWEVRVAEGQILLSQ